MTAESVSRVSEITSEPSWPVRPSSASVALSWLTVLLALTCAYFATNNWCFILLPVGIAAFVADRVMRKLRRQAVARLTMAAVIGLGLGVLLGVTARWAFRESFRGDPPSDVRDVRIWRHYLGGPGEHALIMEFTTTPTVLRSLARRGRGPSKSEKVDKWRAAGGDWEEAFRIFGGPASTRFARYSWMRIRPPENPEVLDLGNMYSGTLVLFHEPATGRCVALHVRY